ncbi:MAG: Ig-like domain-containing domain, partial [Bacteroidota bacterium]
QLIVSIFAAMYRLLFFVIGLGFLLSQCANPLPPVGGEKDEQPPQVDTTRSTPNFQTNFVKQRIELAFDEWVVLEDVFNQVVVSPPLEYDYDVRLRGKKLRFEFAEEEVLRENATYTINFGEAIKDLTEKNPADNLRFVFSTGPFLDSLELSGILVDAFTEEPVEGALFMLYENLADTVVRTERPFYFARADEEGKFKIENIRAGTFKGFALEDVNFNYLFDQQTERIGFADSLIILGDGRTPDQTIKIFEEAADLRLLDNEQRYGLVKMIFNQPPKDYQISYPDLGQTIVEELDKDTLKFWYHQPEALPWRIIVRKDTILQDTIQIENEERDEFFAKANVNPLNLKGKKSSMAVNPSKPFPVLFNLPVDSVRLDSIQVLEDTLLTPIPFTFTADSLNSRRYLLQASWKEKVDYELQIAPNAIVSIYTLSNQDTITQALKIEDRKRFGNIVLNVTGLSADSTYVLQLVQEKNVLQELSLDSLTSTKQEFNALAPSTYTVRIITDWNANGRWDSGNYDQQLQPEPVFRRELDQLRANWDLEVEVKVWE